MAEIEKIAVYDARIIQEPPKFAVQKGALSVSTSQFQAQSASSSMLSFQVLVPSLNVFTDRKVELNTSLYVSAEAVPSQVCQRINGVDYIMAPDYDSQYQVSDQPLTTTYPSNGIYTGQSVNSACVLPSDSWPNMFGSGPTQSTSVGVGAGIVPSFIPFPQQTFAWGGGTWSPAPGSQITTGQFTNPANYSINGQTSTEIVGSLKSHISFSAVVGIGAPTTTKGTGLFKITLIDNRNPSTVMGVAYVTTQWVTDNAQANPTVQVEEDFVMYLNSTTATFNWAAQTKCQFTLEYISGADLTAISPIYATFVEGGTYNATSGSAQATRLWYQPVGAPSDLSLGMFPVQSLANSMTLTINDCSMSVTGDVFREQLLISQTRDSLMQRTCASKVDVYAWTADDARQDNGATQSYGQARDSDIPNGSAPIVFVNPVTGLDLNRFDAYTVNGVTVYIINYRPAFIPLQSGLIGATIPSSSIQGGVVITATQAQSPLPIMYRLQSTEPLCISPFLWQDSKQMSEVGLYGITNMTVTLNFSTPGAVQGYDKNTAQLASTGWGHLYSDRISNAMNSYAYMTRQSGINALFGKVSLQAPQNLQNTSTGPWVSPTLFCTFLTPPPEITLPLVSSVPYVEFPRYNTTASATSLGSTIQVQSNTVTLSSIPDLLVVFVKAAYRGQTQGDTYIPIQKAAVTFDNYANLCANYTQEDLYAASVAGGLDMDWHQFRGYARNRYPTLIPKSSGAEGSSFDTQVAVSPNVQLSGAPIILRMGQDIPLSSGLAPGTLGNYSVQVSLTLDNSNGFFSYLSQLATSNNILITIMGVNSGFFESVRGSSALRKTILNTNDVEAASTSSSVTSSQLARLVGGASGAHTSARLTTSLGAPQFRPAMGETDRVRKMPRMSGSMIP